MRTVSAHPQLIGHSRDAITLTGHLARAPVDKRAEAIGDLNHRVGNRVVTRQILREMHATAPLPSGGKMVSVVGRSAWQRGTGQSATGQRPRVR